jgi:hypothetical protein
MSRLCIAGTVLATALALTACGDGGFVDTTQAKIGEWIDSSGVIKGVMTEADAALMKNGVAGDKVLDHAWTDMIKDADIPGVVGVVKDAAVGAVSGLCTKGYLSTEQAAGMSFAAVEGDVHWNGECSKIIRGE